MTYQLNQTSSGEARAFLLRDDSLIFEQGKPAKGTTTVELTDARVGDRLCVYDLNDHAEQPELPRHQFGCKTVVAGDSQLIMTQDASWNPVITIAQTGPQQLSVTVEQALANGLALQARLIPETDAAGPVQSLARSGDTWSTVFNLAAPVEPVYLQLWVEESPAAPQTRREVMADRGTGGNGAFGPAAPLWRRACRLFGRQCQLRKRRADRAGTGRVDRLAEHAGHAACAAVEARFLASRTAWMRSRLRW